MRYGILSDIHGNLAALEAAVRVLERAGVDRLVCAGDLVGYGPQPNECVALVEELDMTAVAGNHDLMALGVLGDARCDALARSSLRWTVGTLDERAWARLAALPRRVDLPGGVVVAHGSLADPQEYVLGAAGAAAQLARLGGAGVLVLGHTHRALASDGSVVVQDPADDHTVPLATAPAWVLNPGAVGQSREPRVRSRCLVLDLDRGAATFRAVRYDVRRTRAALRRAGLPARSVHLAPWRPRALVRAARRARTEARRA